MQNLVTERELMQSMKCSRTTLYRWRKQGMPYYLVGKTVRYDLVSVLKWAKKKQIA